MPSNTLTIRRVPGNKSEDGDGMQVVIRHIKFFSAFSFDLNKFWLLICEECVQIKSGNVSFNFFHFERKTNSTRLLGNLLEVVES